MRRIFALAIGAVAVLMLSATMAVALDDTGTTESPAAKVLGELVEQGVITTDQATAIQEAMETRFAEIRAERGTRGSHRLEGAAEVIGIDVDTLKTALQEGSTLAEVAEANDVSREDLVAGLVAQAEERLAEAVAAGDLTEAEAAEKLAEISERIEAKVDGEFSGKGPRGRRGHHGAAGFGSNDA